MSAITETKIMRRPNTSTPFYADTAEALALWATIQAKIHEAYPDMKVAFDNNNRFFTKTLSEDGLTLTTVSSLSNLDRYSQFDSFLSIQLDAAFATYNNAHGIEHLGYTQAGITVPFKVTTTYTFPSNEAFAAEVADQVAQLAENIRTNGSEGGRDAGTLTTLVVNANSIVATHQYSNSANFSAHHWSDNHRAIELDAVGCTRTVQYALV
jgi:hypothetical protein